MQTAKRLSMVILMQNDVEKAMEFYQDLGCSQIFHLEGKWAELALDGVKIGLCATDNEPTTRRTGLVFEVADLELLYQTRKDTWMFTNELVTKVHGIMTSVQDPGGNIIDLYQPTPEKVQELVRKVKEQDGDSCQGAGRTQEGCCKAQEGQC